MGSKCRLSCFARSFVAQHFLRCTDDETGPAAELFPIALPYPEVFAKKHQLEDEAMTLKKGVCALVIVLNYLHLGRPARSDERLWGRRKLSRKQWEAVRRFEAMLQAWDSVSQISPEVMGRTASKVETLEDTLEQLEVIAQGLDGSSNKYFARAKGEDQLGQPVEDTGAVVGRMKGAPPSTFKQVDPDRLTFVGRPSYDPTPYLDPLSRRIYLDPCGERLAPSEVARRPPKLRVHCSRSAKIKLFDLLDSSSRLRLHLPHEVLPDYGSGMFCVGKDLLKDRMILDSRGANLLESPPARWIRSLGSAESLTRLVLEEDELLQVSGNDLRDFYYLFSATPSRSRRNVLVGAMRPQELAHLRCLKPEHHGAPAVYGALSSLAMGDCQAVEMAQSAHLGMALQWSVATPQNLMTMSKPLPRTSTAVGLVIDDFIAMSKVSRDQARAGTPSPGGLLADKMQDGYEEVKLIPNKKKAFRDETEASFWGIDFDGDRGLLRGSLRRAIPLSNLIFRLVKIGYSSRNLMEIMSGSIISLCLYRRRFLSLMDSIFESYRGKEGQEIFAMSGKLKSDLLCLAILLPVAVTNLRAGVPEHVVASDASNWGEAGVVARIPKAVGKEMLRHCIRKSVWTRLLTPHQAWLRGHGMLEEDQELPDPEEAFSMNPLWAVLARGLHYRLLFSKQKSGARHINIGELRGALRAEKLMGNRHPSRRVLLGLDSQVVVGAMLKGRSSSHALNKELAKSIPVMVGYDIYSELMYYNTKVNRADQPTRGKDIEAPDLELPPWWEEVAQGEYANFDAWLQEHALDDLCLAGLPDLDELRGNVSPSDILSPQASERSEPGGYGKTKQEAEVAKSLPSSTSTARLASAECGTVEDGRDEAASGDLPDKDVKAASCAPATGEVDGSSSSSTSARLPRQTVACGRPETLPEQHGASQKPPRLSEAARKMLADFPRGQVVLPAGVSWPPERAGYLDLYSGEKGVAKSIRRHGRTWSLCFDIEDGASQDLNDAGLRKKLEAMVKARCFLGIGGGPVCRTFSMAVRPPVRSKTEPYGKQEVSAKMKVKIEEGNDMALWCIRLLDIALSQNLTVWLENPGSSWLFRLPAWKELEKKWPQLRPWTVDYCRYGMPWRKRTKFYNNGVLSDVRTLCAGCAQHQHLKGRSKAHGKSWTLVAQPYPPGVAEAVALCALHREGLVDLDQHFDPAACAKVGHRRVGEAAHPGPRARAVPRTGLLEEVPLVEAKTKALQDKVWGSFLGWLNSTLTPGAVHSAMAHPSLLVLLAREYGNFLYSSGRSLYVFRHLLVFLQQNVVTIRPLMGPCWTMVTKWELMEPTVHRVPLPHSIFCAMVSVSLGWNWYRFAGILILGFLGIARPGEPLAAYRSELVLPRDTLDQNSKAAYLKILKPKTRQRGRGVTQHLSIHDPAYIEFLDKVYGPLPSHARLLDCSPGAFRRRWDAVLAALSVPKEANLTPGGLRGGGCVYAFQQGADLTLLLWRMRIKHLQTLESYLQEVVASTVVSELPSEPRQKIAVAAKMVDHFLQSTPRTS
eukprot:Skav235078  [mRNA]  locus=scaffold2106:3814:8424:- [translate_table: standard]